MKRIEVRANNTVDNASIDEIGFSDCDGRYRVTDKEYYVRIYDKFNDNAEINKDDIDNLIEALKKAKELWVDP